MKRTLVAISMLMISMLACQLTGLTPLSQPTQAPQVQVQTSPPILTNPDETILEDGSLSALYELVLPGVVSIGTDIGQRSGFVFDNEGHVVTNHHVVEGASTVEVAFSSGFKAYGTVIGSHADADIAVIQVDPPAEQIRPLAIGDSQLRHRIAPPEEN